MYANDTDVDIDVLSEISVDLVDGSSGLSDVEPGAVDVASVLPSPSPIELGQAHSQKVLEFKT